MANEDSNNTRGSKKTFILHTDTLSILDDIDADKVKQLFIAMRDYNSGKDVVLNDPIVGAYFSMFKTFFDRDAAKYEERCDKNRENIRRRWEKLNNQNQDTNEYERIQPNTNDTKHTYTDTVTDTDSDTDISLSKDKNINNNIYVGFISSFNEIKGAKFKATEKVKKQFNARMKEGFTVDQMLAALKNAMQSEYHIKNNLRFLTPEFFTRSDKIELYCNDSGEKNKKSQEQIYY